MAPFSKVRLRGELTPPGDKSVGHRLAFLSAVAQGTSTLEGFPPGQDCARSLDVARALGVDVSTDGAFVKIAGRGLDALAAPTASLDAGNSGTTARLACGYLAPQGFDSRLVGDESLSRRPFGRVIDPLTQMGARFETSHGRLPLTIRGGQSLHPIDYTLPVPSAQVKTSLMLAGLFLEGTTVVRERLPSRDHTEIALRGFGAGPTIENGSIALVGRQTLEAGHFRIPGDFSSAAFFIAGAAILPGSDLIVSGTGLNPTRTGLLDALVEMGADITMEPDEQAPHEEPMGTIRIKGGRLRGITVDAARLPAMIDEIPVLAVAAAYADGPTRLHGASELRVKESDRLHAIVTGLRALGATVDETEDGFIIQGGSRLHPAELRSFGDHRMVMAWAVASLGVGGDCRIDYQDQVKISYPGFWAALDRLAAPCG